MAPTRVEVVADEEHGHFSALTQPTQEVQNLGLDGHIQSRCGFIGNEQQRISGQGDGYHHSLLLAAGQFVGKGPIPALGIGQSHLFEKRQHFSSGFPLVQFPASAHGFGHLAADGHDGVEATHGVLENDRGHPASHGSEFFGFQSVQVISGQADRSAGLDSHAVDGQAQDGLCGHALARPGFADQPQGLTGGNGQIDISDHLGPFRAGTKGDAQIFYFQ